MPHANTVQSPQGGEEKPSEFKTFLALAGLWDLNVDEQMTLLGNPARSTYFKWKKEDGQLAADTCERISHLLAIEKALQILFTEPNRGDAWLRRPNQFFSDRTALEIMLGGKLADILRVRIYLDAQRGG